MTGTPPVSTLDCDIGGVRRLLAHQCPQWAHLSLTPIHSDGTDNTLFHLGEELCVRLPKREDALPQIEKELTWLPKFQDLPLEIPEPVFVGEASPEFPARWGVFRWIDGNVLDAAPSLDQIAVAGQLAAFLQTLQLQWTAGAPEAGAHNHYRGVPLAYRDPLTRTAITNLADLFDTAVLNRLWDQYLDAPVYDGSPVWVHGDIHARNLIARSGALAGVIDFGLMGVGDPAVDVMVAWTLFDVEARTAFRTALDVDDAMWQRSKGWALSWAVIALDYYRHRDNAYLVDLSTRTLKTLLDTA